MKRRLLKVLATLAALFTIGYLLMLFLFYYEPTPNKGEVEDMVKERDLMEFGEVEGSFLLTPRNYGYYDERSIYIVEQYLDKGGNYGDQYVVIEKGVELTGKDEKAVNQIRSREAFHDGYRSDLQVLTKHRMTVHKNNEKTLENWLFKITYKYDGQYFLTFMLAEETEGNRFNFFTEGYEQFLQF